MTRNIEKHAQEEIDRTDGVTTQGNYKPRKPVNKTSTESIS